MCEWRAASVAGAPGRPWLPLLLLLVAYIACTATATETGGGCLVPSHWRGSWFQSGVRDVISLTRTELSSKGSCVYSKGDKYVFEDKEQQCYRCVALSEKHPNILQYKETFCEKTHNFHELCAQIPADGLLFSLFRRDATPITCPFKGPLSFSYTRGGGQCRQPKSTIHSCTSDTRLLFKYQACPDVPSTESSVEEVQCLGHWKEGSTRYFVAYVTYRISKTDEDKYRCFAWEKARPGESHLDYRMAMSGDATCNGVFSAYDGSRTLEIKKEGSYPGCTFPDWVTAHHRWHALDHGATYTLAHHNTTLRLHHNHNPRATATPPPGQVDVSSKAEASQVCTKEVNISPSKATLITHYTSECSSGYVCTILYRRDDHVIEMQIGTRSIQPEEACTSHYFDPSTAAHVTLTSGSPSHRPCPLVGVWVAAEGECGRGVTHLHAGCTNHHHMDFVHTCEQDRVTTTYVCHGHWAEGGSVFVVASSPDKPNHRLCLTATSLTPDHATPAAANINESALLLDNKNSSKTLQIHAHAHSCPRRSVPPTTTISGNLTVQGECEQFSSGVGSTFEYNIVIVLLAATVFLQLLHQLKSR